MRIKFVWAALPALMLAAPASAQWADPYAALKQLQRSQALQAQQEQARAMQQQLIIQQQQLELQRQEMVQQRLEMQRQLQLQQQQLELQRQQMAQQQQPVQQLQMQSPSAAPRQQSRSVRLVTTEGVLLKSETNLGNGWKQCGYNNGYERVIPVTDSCFGS